LNRRVLIVDDHPIIRAGLEQALVKANFTICAVAASKNEAIAQIARTNPNLICLI
jgi:DNA-binding NarL/FixJ family response regulator